MKKFAVSILCATVVNRGLLAHMSDSAFLLSSFSNVDARYVGWSRCSPSKMTSPLSCLVSNWVFSGLDILRNSVV